MSVPRRFDSDRNWYPVAGALLLGGPVWHGFFDGRYSFTTPEAIVVPAAAAGGGALLGWVARRSRGPFGPALIALALVWFGDLQFDIDRQLSVLARVALVLGLVALLHAHIGRVLTVTVGAFCLASLVRAGPPTLAPPVAGRADRAPPLLVHIILDAEWSPNGFRAVGDSATAWFLTDFYRSRGFRIYPGAYSRYRFTTQSIGAEFGLGEPAGLDSAGSGRLATNRYFDRLEAAGYQLRVFQTSHLDFCGRRSVTQCSTAAANALGNLGHLAAPWPTRAAMATRYLLEAKLRWAARLVGPRRSGSRHSVVGRALSVAETARKDIAAYGGPGVGYVIHLMMPHGPWEVDEHCAAFPTVRIRDSVNNALDRQASVEPYARQVRCAHRAVERLLATIDRVAGPAGNIVIVQGDHGPRLGTRATKPLSQFGVWELNAAFPALLAVRAPGIERGIVEGAMPISELFARVVELGFTGAPSGDWPAFVIDPIGEAGGRAEVTRKLTAAEMPWDGLRR